MHDNQFDGAEQYKRQFISVPNCKDTLRSGKTRQKLCRKSIRVPIFIMADIHFEPYKIHSVEYIKTTTKAERTKALELAGKLQKEQRENSCTVV